MPPDQGVTVVIPTKDRPDLLHATLRSVLSQVGVELAVVVVDDGSSSPAQAGLPADPRLELVRHDVARGVHAARNAGLSRARRPWTAFVDDDDLWGPHKLRRQLHAVRDTACQWVCSGSVSFTADEVIDVTEPPAAGDLSEALLHGNVISGSASSVLVRTDLARDVGGFDETLPSLEDWDLWIRLAQRSPLATVRHPDVGYRVHPTSSANDLDKQRRALRLMTDKYARATPPLVVEPDVYFREYWARLDYRSGNWSGGLRRTADLLVRERHVRALRTPVRALLPAAAQQTLRARRLAALASADPDLDWQWIRAHLSGA